MLKIINSHESFDSKARGLRDQVMQLQLLQNFLRDADGEPLRPCAPHPSCVFYTVLGERGKGHHAGSTPHKTRYAAYKNSRAGASFIISIVLFRTNPLRKFCAISCLIY